MVFTLYRRQSVQSEFPFISLQTWHKFGSTSRNFDRGRKGGVVPEVCLPDQPITTPDSNFICGYQLPSPPPPPSTPFYCIPYCGQSSTVPGACVSHISSTSKSIIFHLLIPVWVFETEDRMAFARITQVRLVKFFIRKTEKTKCKLIKFLFEFKTRGECQPLTP